MSPFTSSLVARGDLTATRAPAGRASDIDAADFIGLASRVGRNGLLRLVARRSANTSVKIELFTTKWGPQRPSAGPLLQLEYTTVSEFEGLSMNGDERRRAGG